jgi:hypothetical protein
MPLLKWIPLLLLSLLTACSDERASFSIETSDHALTLIREQRYFWDQTPEYAIVASRMPTCMRRHKMVPADFSAKVEVYSPGNNAWILKQNDLMYVVETRTCEGFARLTTEPEDGMGPLVGTFESKDDSLVFVAAPPVAPPAEVTAVSASTPAPQRVAAPVAPEPAEQ